MAKQKETRDALLDLLRGDKAPGPLLREVSVHDLEWFDQTIDWQLLSLSQQQENDQRTVRGGRWWEPAEERRKYKMRCEQIQRQVRDVLHDKRAEARRWAWVRELGKDALLVLLGALVGWALARYFPGGG